MKRKDFLLLLSLLQFTLYLTTIFNMPLVEQVIGFFYFIFFPGTIIVKLIKIDKLNYLEDFILSCGLSVAFLMTSGLFLNEVCLALGIQDPLSPTVLLSFTSSLVFILGVLVCRFNENIETWIEGIFRNLSRSSLVLLCLPVLSIAGAMSVTVFNDNLLSLALILAISILFLLGCASRNLLPQKLYPFAIIVTAVALLFQTSLVSQHIVSFESDVPIEFFTFSVTRTSSYWSSTGLSSLSLGYARVYDMLSVTILPTFFSNVLNLDPSLVFKLLFPLIFSLVPLSLYVLWSSFIEPRYAFIAAFFFMAEQTFYMEMLGLNRQMIGELFFVLLLFTIFSGKLKKIPRSFCFIFFTFGLVVSHYALAEFMLFFLGFALVYSIATKRKIVYSIATKRKSKRITPSMFVFFFAVMFFWYIYTCGSASLNSLVQTWNFIYGQWGSFFSPTSRGGMVLTGVGLQTPPTIWNAVGRAFAYITELLIVVGFVALTLRKTKVKLDSEYYSLTLFSMALLAACVIVPGFANAFNMTRTYHLTLFFLAPFCVLGTSFLAGLCSKRRTELLALLLLAIVLVAYFLFQTGFVYEITQSQSLSLPLSGHRMTALELYYSVGYMDSVSIAGAQWLSQNVGSANPIYADIVSINNVLPTYGMIYPSRVDVLSNVTQMTISGVAFLNSLNVQNGIVVAPGLWNTHDLSVLNNTNIIYSNGGTEIIEEP